MDFEISEATCLKHYRMHNSRYNRSLCGKNVNSESTGFHATDTKSADPTRYKIRFVAENFGDAEGELTRFHSPITVEALAKALPLEGRAARWREEIYFETAVRLGAEKPRPKVEVGTIAYWPMGSAICVFYGPTSPYSPVNVLGKVVSNLDLFRTIKSGTRIRVERL